ncbi:MAG TPA: DUF1579 domain-containing protein [Lacipirellulaceae bacterium]
MKKNLFVAGSIAAGCALAVVASLAIAETQNTQVAGQPEFKLPPGWTMEDMEACMLAGTPGEEHKKLAEAAGTWHGKVTMWMAPDTEPMPTSECTAKITPIMDGRFTKCEWTGEMPGMGPYNGFGITGFDNVSKKYTSIWIDNHGTGMMQGEGEQSADGKVLTLTYTQSCPITKKPAQIRSVETVTGPDTKTLEMFATEPKSGKEYKMMRAELTKKEDAAQAGG